VHRHAKYTLKKENGNGSQGYSQREGSGKCSTGKITQHRRHDRRGKGRCGAWRRPHARRTMAKRICETGLRWEDQSPRASGGLATEKKVDRGTSELDRRGWGEPARKGGGKSHTAGGAFSLEAAYRMFQKRREGVHGPGEIAKNPVMWEQCRKNSPVGQEETEEWGQARVCGPAKKAGGKAAGLHTARGEVSIN